MKTKQKKLYNSYIYGHFEVWTFQQKCTYDKLTGIQICTSWAKMNFSQYTMFFILSASSMISSKVKPVQSYSINRYSSEEKKESTAKTIGEAK